MEENKVEVKLMLSEKEKKEFKKYLEMLNAPWSRNLGATGIASIIENVNARGDIA